MVDMVEKVARALCERDIRIKRRWDTPRDELEAAMPRNVDYHWRSYAEEARAAIEAMRVPSEAMLEAGPPEPYMDAGEWAKMIDAALNCPEGETI